MPQSTATPMVLMPCDRRIVGSLPNYTLGEKYVDAVRHGAGALPFPLITNDPPLDHKALLDLADGLLLPGAVSNIDPGLYGGPAPPDAASMDTHRDANTLPLIHAAIERELPILAICRGFQELNIALGGSLHQDLASLASPVSHHAPTDVAITDSYAHCHTITIAPGGQLAQILPEQDAITVNSVHYQGIDRPAEALRIEAIASDGTIEAVSLDGYRGFCLGVQWHPEWRFQQNSVSLAIFQAFGAALLAYHRNKRK